MEVSAPWWSMCGTKLMPNIGSIPKITLVVRIAILRKAYINSYSGPSIDIPIWKLQDLWWYPIWRKAYGMQSELNGSYNENLPSGCTKCYDITLRKSLIPSSVRKDIERKWHWIIKVMSLLPIPTTCKGIFFWYCEDTIHDHLLQSAIGGPQTMEEEDEGSMVEGFNICHLSRWLPVFYVPRVLPPAYPIIAEQDRKASCCREAGFFTCCVHMYMR